MRKRPKISLSILIILMLTSILSLLLVNRSIAAEDSNLNNVHLVLDPFNHNSLPKHFRKTSDLTSIKDSKNLKLNGLGKLNISGSQQFSENNLPLLIKEIGTSLPITVVDLRQESHGFINGLPVSWADSKNNANAGLTREQVLLDEANKLKSIKLNVPITFYNKTKETVIPTKVQDEKGLVESKDLSYNRITVRDGGIPSDDMVDYFVESVKAQPKNSWLHFHCKHGIGRTNTFMIMYDMMKNYREIDDDDIIKRQVALANFDESTAKSFYNNERISFLKKFYEYCKKNGDSFNIKWSEWKKAADAKSSTAFYNNAIFKNTSSYIKNTVEPTFLYVISQDSMTSSERTMIASLQGVVNNHCSSQIYTLSSSEPDYKIWLEDLKDNYKVSYKIISDPWQLLSIYKDYIDGKV